MRVGQWPRLWARWQQRPWRAPLRPFGGCVMRCNALTAPCTSPVSPQPPCSLQSVFPLIAEGQRTATSQAIHQLFGLFVTLMFASVGGALGGE